MPPCCVLLSATIRQLSGLYTVQIILYSAVCVTKMRVYLISFSCSLIVIQNVVYTSVQFIKTVYSITNSSFTFENILSVVSCALIGGFFKERFFGGESEA